jgi:hypothetical protein
MQSQIATLKNTLQSLNATAPMLNIIKNTNINFKTLSDTAVDIPIKSLLNEIVGLWEMGITFNIV